MSVLSRSVKCQGGRGCDGLLCEGSRQVRLEMAVQRVVVVLMVTGKLPKLRAVTGATFGRPRAVLGSTSERSPTGR